MSDIQDPRYFEIHKRCPICTGYNARIIITRLHFCCLQSYTSSLENNSRPTFHIYKDCTLGCTETLSRYHVTLLFQCCGIMYNTMFYFSSLENGKSPTSELKNEENRQILKFALRACSSEQARKSLKLNLNGLQEKNPWESTEERGEAVTRHRHHHDHHIQDGSSESSLQELSRDPSDFLQVDVGLRQEERGEAAAQKEEDRIKKEKPAKLINEESSLLRICDHVTHHRQPHYHHLQDESAESSLQDSSSTDESSESSLQDSSSSDESSQEDDSTDEVWRQDIRRKERKKDEGSAMKNIFIILFILFLRNVNTRIRSVIQTFTNVLSFGLGRKSKSAEEKEADDKSEVNNDKSEENKENVPPFLCCPNIS